MAMHNLRKHTLVIRLSSKHRSGNSRQYDPMQENSFIDILVRRCLIRNGNKEDNRLFTVSWEIIPFAFIF